MRVHRASNHVHVHTCTCAQGGKRCSDVRPLAAHPHTHYHLGTPSQTSSWKHVLLVATTHLHPQLNPGWVEGERTITWARPLPGGREPTKRRASEQATNNGCNMRTLPARTRPTTQHACMRLWRTLSQDKTCCGERDPCMIARKGPLRAQVPCLKQQAAASLLAKKRKRASQQ